MTQRTPQPSGADTTSPDTSSAEKISVSVKAAGEMLGLSSWQVKQRCDSGALKARFDGRQRLVEVDSIRAYFESLPTERPAS